MKKMLIIIPSFSHGGTNRSLCNIIDLFNFSAHNIAVDLFCVKFSKQGLFYEEFNKRNIRILPKSFLFSLYHYEGKNYIRRMISRIIKSFPKSVDHFIQKTATHKYTNKYDMVVAMEEGLATRIASYIEAPKRFAWVRCMYDRYQQLNCHIDETRYYEKFDNIVCVSNACKTVFTDVYPQYTCKTRCIPNTQNKSDIIQKSTESISKIQCPSSCFCIVSIGRLDVVKQFDHIPQIVSEIQRQGKHLFWYIFGEGTERQKIEKKIEKYAVSESVYLPGAVANPYPEIKRADLVAITSSSESFCNVVTEAEILGTRVISTPFPAIYDSMRNHDTSVICPLDEFPKRIVKIMNETSLPTDFAAKPTDTTYDEAIHDFVSALEELLCD